MGGCSTKPKTTEFEGSMDPTFEDTVDEKGYSLQSLLLEQAAKLSFSGFTEENGKEERLTSFLGKDMEGLVTQKEALLIEAKKETLEFLKERLVASQEKLVACQEKIFKESGGADLQQKIKVVEVDQTISKDGCFQQKLKAAILEQKTEETTLEHNLTDKSTEHNVNAERNDQQIKEENAKPAEEFHSNVNLMQKRNVANASEIHHNGGGIKNGISEKQSTASILSYTQEDESSPRHKCAMSENEGRVHEQCAIGSAYKSDSLDLKRDRWIHMISKCEQGMQIRSPCHNKICQDDKNLASIERIEPLVRATDFLAPDIDEVFEKLASEFERQESLSASCRS